MRLSLRLSAPSPARSFAVFSGLLAALLRPAARPARAQYGQPPAATYSAPAFSGGQWFSSYRTPGTPIPYSSGGNGICTGDSSMQVNSTGTVTAAFTWSDAGNPADPAPPCVIKQTGYAEWYGVPPFTSSPSCSDGLGDPEVGSSSGQTLQGRSSGTRYGLGVPSSGVISVSLTGAQANVRPTGVDSGMFGSSVNWAVTAYPIVLSSPDPLGRPDLGDGKNQFVYTADTPDGYLYVPGAIQVTGAPPAAVNWLINNSPIVGPLDKVNLTIDSSVIPNTFTHQWAISGNTIYVNTPQDVNNPYPSYQFNHWIFKGLPSDNSGFGNHTVNLLVQGAKTQTAKIQTFFNTGVKGAASNWPSSDGTPNWYYYYAQVYNPFSSAAPGTYSSGSPSETINS